LSAPTGKPRITIVLLSYKRPQNIPVILNAIKEQTESATVFLWNNGVEDVNSPMIDYYEKSDKNVGCMARWKMARMASTPYVMSLDDDICFNRADALENIILSLEQLDNPDRIIGFIGANFGRTPEYSIRNEHMCRYGDVNRKTRNISDTYERNRDGETVFVRRRLIRQDKSVDLIKGRAMAFRKQLLDEIDLPEEREDDIYLSATFANRARKFHRIPFLLNDAFYELPELGTGNWQEKTHGLSRDRALKAYFSPIELST
jgi:hypothetical protein